MSNSNQDFTLHSGDKKIVAFSIVDADGNPLDLSDYGVEWLMQEDQYDYNPFIERSTTDSSIIITDVPNGQGYFTLEPEDTESVQGRYYHELFVTKVDGSQLTVLTGNATVKPSIKNETREE